MRWVGSSGIGGWTLEELEGEGGAAEEFWHSLASGRSSSSVTGGVARPVKAKSDNSQLLQLQINSSNPRPIMLLLPYTLLVVRFLWEKIPQKSCGLGLLNGDNMFKESSSKQRYQVWLFCWNLCVQLPLSPLFPFLYLFPNRILLRLIAITSTGVKVKLCTMYMCPMALLKSCPQNFCRLVRSLMGIKT